MNEGTIRSDTSHVINSLAAAADSWRHQYRMLGERLAGLRTFYTCLSATHPDHLLRQEVIDELSPFYDLYSGGDCSTADFNEALGVCVRLEARAKAQPAGDEAGRAYGALHSLVNILSVLRNTSANIVRLASEANSALATATDGGDAAELLTVGSASGETLNLEIVERLSTTCRNLVTHLPPPAASGDFKYAGAESVSNKIYLLVVEDDLAWLPEVESVVKGVASAYRSATREVKVGIARTYQDAMGVLRNLEPSPESEWSVIMILDIGLPHDAGELEGIERYATTVGRRWGRELLRFARSYRQRYDVIVFTSVANYPEDHRSALEAGVAPSAFILKGPGAVHELEQNIHHVIAPRKAPRLEIVDGAGQRLRLNGVEVELDPSPFRTLCVLCRNRRRRLNVEEIAELLEQNYPGEYKRWDDVDDTWELARERAAAEGFERGSPEHHRRANELLVELSAPGNAFEAWRAALRSQGKEGEGKNWVGRVISAFYDKCTADYEGGYPWRWFCEFAGVPMAPPSHWGEPALSKAYRVARKALTAVQLRPGGFDPDSIHDHVYHIRTRLYSAAHVDAVRDVLRTEEGEDGFGYRVVADAVFLSGDAGRQQEWQLADDEPCKVLVVENDPAWAEQVVAALKTGWYVVETAATIADAIELARSFAPQILCLDLHLPQDGDELRRLNAGEGPGDVTGGIQVLKRVQSFNPHVKAVVLSSFVNDDEVRILATRAGVDVHDIVSKLHPAGPWDGAFLRAVWKNEQELRRGVLLPAEDDNLPFISIKLEESTPGVRGRRVTRGARVTSAGGDRRVPLTESEFKLLSAFRDSGYRPIPKDELMELLYGDDWPDKQEAFDNVLKRLRQAIVQTGLGVPSGQARKVGTTLITHSGGAYLLKCKIL